MKIMMSKFIQVKSNMLKNMTKMIYTMIKENSDRLSSRIITIKMNFRENHSKIIIIQNNHNTLTMSNNKIGVDNKDIMKMKMFSIRNIKAEGEDTTKAIQVMDMEEHKGDIKEEDINEEDMREMIIRKVDMKEEEMREIIIREKKILEDVVSEIMIYQCKQINSKIQDIKMLKIKIMNLIIASMNNMKTKILIIKSRVNILHMKNKTIDKMTKTMKDADIIMMKNIMKNN